MGATLFASGRFDKSFQGAAAIAARRGAGNQGSPPPLRSPPDPAPSPPLARYLYPSLIPQDPKEGEGEGEGERARWAMGDGRWAMGDGRWRFLSVPASSDGSRPSDAGASCCAALIHPARRLVGGA